MPCQIKNCPECAASREYVRRLVEADLEDLGEFPPLPLYDWPVPVLPEE